MRLSINSRSAAVVGFCLVGMFLCLASPAWGQVTPIPDLPVTPATELAPTLTPPASSAPPPTDPPTHEQPAPKEEPCGRLAVLCNVATGIGKAMQDPTVVPEAAVGAVFDKAAGLSVGAITDWVANGAAWLMGQLGGLIGGTTTPQLEAGWFAEHYRAMVGLAAVIVLPLLLLSIIGALVAQDLGRLLRTVFGFLPLAGIFAATAVGFVVLGLTITDGMTSWVTQGAGADATAFLTRSADALHGLQGGDNAALFAVFLGAVVMALGAVVVWIELLVRQAAIYVAVLFLPLAVAGLVWPATAHWFKRLAHILVAVILSKFVIAAILSLAASGLAASSADGGGFSAVLSGGALLTLAALSPMALLKLAPILEAGLVSTTANARSGKTAATGAALGGPGWLYGQARNWASRDSTTPPLRTWGSPKPGMSAAGAGGPKPWAAGGAAKAAGAARPQGVALAPVSNVPTPSQPTLVGAGAAPGMRRRIGDGRGAPGEKNNGS
jgi:hypothetical protein